MSNLKIYGALARAQEMAQVAVRDSENKNLNSKYADIESIVEAIRNAAAKNDLAFVAIPAGASRVVNRVVVDTKNGRREVAECLMPVEVSLLHSSGESLKFAYEIPFKQWDAQGFGSALTYARKYSMLAVFNVATADDDGAAASGKADVPQAPAIAHGQVQRAKRLPPSVEPATKTEALPPAVERPTELPEAFDPIEESVESLQAAVEAAKDFAAMSFLNKDDALKKLPEEARIVAYAKWALLTSTLAEFDVVNADRRLSILTGKARDEVREHLSALKASKKGSK